MAKSYNKTIIIGRLGETPELKEANRGCKTDCYTTFKICNSTFKDGVEEIQGHTIVCFGKQARVCCEHLIKGDLCCIEGKFDRRAYEKDGETKYSTAIIAERIVFLSKARKKEEEPENEPETVNEQVAE